MILIDASYVNSEGGRTLLFYLIKNIEKNNIETYYLLDERIKNIWPNSRNNNIIFIKSSILTRYKAYKKILKQNKIEKILCFGNIPPFIRYKQEVFTYFQNVLLLSAPTDFFSFSEKLKWCLKHWIIKFNKRNSDYWLIQTEIVQEELCMKMGIKKEKCIVIPFYDHSKVILPSAIKEKNSFIYVSSADPHKNHLNLLKAWEILFSKGYNFALHLTVTANYNVVYAKINQLKEKGLNILNHEYLNKEKLDKLYSKTEFLVFPSIRESFGLGLIEAASMDCKVIVSNLPYAYAVIEPTVVFDPYDVQSIINAVLLSLLKEKKTIIKTENRIIDLINILKNNDI